LKKNKDFLSKQSLGKNKRRSIGQSKLGSKSKNELQKLLNEPTERKHEQRNKKRRKKSKKSDRLRKPKNRKSKESHENKETKISLKNLKAERLKNHLEK